MNPITQERDGLGDYQVLILVTAAKYSQELQAVDEGLSFHVALIDFMSWGCHQEIPQIALMQGTRHFKTYPNQAVLLNCNRTTLWQDFEFLTPGKVAGELV
jgi:hypothetical protein